MDAMEAKMLEWRKKVPSKRQLTSTLGKIVQQKSVAVLYTPSEQDRIKKMTDLIAAATSEYERGEHWDRIIAVVDALSSASNRNVLRESIRYLRLRLGDPSPRVVILALTLTEAVVKNCGHLVHLEIATEPFMHELEALHKTHNGKCSRDSLEIAERILDMVQAWGEAFLPYRHDYPLFIETYHNMRKRGVKFPVQYDETKVPVLTPPSATAAAAGRTVDTSSVSSASSALAGLSHVELYRVAVNITEMFEDMLHEAHKADSSLSNEGVILELALQARELVQRMESVIQTAVAEGSESLGEYLSVNDSLNAALKRYDELSTRRAARLSNQHEHDRASVSSNNQTNGIGDDNDDNDPFAEFVQQRAGSSHSATSKSSSKQQEQQAPPSSQQRSNQIESDDYDGDDDPFASFVQQRAAKILGGSGGGDALASEEKTPVPVEMNLIDLWDDAPVSNQLPSASVTATPTSDLWGDDDLLAAPSSTHSSVQSIAATIMATPTAAPPSLIDDLWGDAFSSPTVATSVAPAPAPSASLDPFATFQVPAATVATSVDSFASYPAPTSAASINDPFATFVASTASAPTARASVDPFDLLDFGHKTSISSPSSSPSNPFDLVSMPPASMRSSFSAPPQPQPQPPKSFNPFDF